MEGERHANRQTEGDKWGSDKEWMKQMWRRKKKKGSYVGSTYLRSYVGRKPMEKRAREKNERRIMREIREYAGRGEVKLPCKAVKFPINYN